VPATSGCVPARARRRFAPILATCACLALAGGARARDPLPREPCTRHDPLRQPFFGDLHVHTYYSADASIFGTRAGPRDAYAFARGATISVADDNEEQTRTATIDRPIDFAAVTDHSEFIGEVDLCTTVGSPIYDDPLCVDLRKPEPDLSGRFLTIVEWLTPAGIPNPPPSLPVCDTPGVDCDAAAASVWQDMQAAAEEAYDRTAACTFTTFIGYEHTPSPGGRHMHRNVIFRDDRVPPRPASFLETAKDGTLHGLWTALDAECIKAGDGCDAVVIPHNTNLSGGLQLVDPVDGDEAALRKRFEPLIEIHQVKGNSECRFDRIAGAGTGTADEFCAFEQKSNPHEGPDATPLPVDQYPRRNLVRNALEDGLLLERTLGANPFQMGFVGSTDSHNATPGDTDEANWVGGIGGNEDSSPERQIANIENNPGGLAVVWAEENSRDSIFDALKRRETYATSGTRPIVRFFGGWKLAKKLCRNRNMVKKAYRRGVPMGGVLEPRKHHRKRPPRFLVWAAKDPGTAARPGTDLERIQIVKGWLDVAGAVHERVVDVVGEPTVGLGVDPATCDPVGAGASELCTVWVDPDFDPAESAFYYARVLERPSCRWSTFVCKREGIDPFAADCATQAGDGPFANCCLNETNAPSVSPTIRERAWTSPIWYTPRT
jgi:hypothetical protein